LGFLSQNGSWHLGFLAAGVADGMKDNLAGVGCVFADAGKSRLEVKMIGRIPEWDGQGLKALRAVRKRRKGLYPGVGLRAVSGWARPNGSLK
jgi:hypothetical protein